VFSLVLQAQEWALWFVVSGPPRPGPGTMYPLHPLSKGSTHQYIYTCCGQP